MPELTIDTDEDEEWQSFVNTYNEQIEQEFQASLVFDSEYKTFEDNNIAR